MRLESLRPLPGSDRLSAVFSDGQKLRLSRMLCAEYGLAQGTELSEEEYAALRRAASAASAKERAVRILSASNVSKKQLARRLREKGETAEDTENAVAWLSELELLDDRRTGEAIVRSALGKGYGEKRIRQILWEKEIPREDAEALLSALPPMDETVDRLLRQKLRAGETDKKEIHRAVQALLRMGHSWQDIREGLRRLDAGDVWEEDSF